MTRHLLTIDNFSADETMQLFERTAWLKAKLKAGEVHQPLAGQTLGMIFAKPSTRTRISFEVAMYQLGGHALHLATSGTQMGRGETYADTARVMSRFVNGVMIRTYDQQVLEEFAEAGHIPVINGLTDFAHPCQVLTDLFTVSENFGLDALRDCSIAYVGDGNNMCTSWMIAAMQLGFTLRIAAPEGFVPDASVVKRVQDGGFSNIHIGTDPVAAVKGVQVVNTDTWVSMGQEGDGEDQKKSTFMPYQVNTELLAHASSDAIVLHCLPAHRGEEITDEVMDGPQSRVFDEAENRLHTQKAILEMLMT